MKYNEIDKLLFYFGFDEGIRNIRKKKDFGCTLVVYFEDTDNIDKICIGLRIKNSNETTYFCSIKTEFYEQVEKALDTILTTLKIEVTKFTDSLNNQLNNLVKKSIISNWG